MRINEDKSIEINRGDAGTITLINKSGVFKVGDILKLSIVECNNYNKVYFQKEYKVDKEKDTFDITLSSEDTKFGNVISMKKIYWYEIEYNGNQTIVGYDENGAKEFILYPEAPNKEVK